MCCCCAQTGGKGVHLALNSLAGRQAAGARQQHPFKVSPLPVAVDNWWSLLASLGVHAAPPGRPCGMLCMHAHVVSPDHSHCLNWPCRRRCAAWRRSGQLLEIGKYDILKARAAG